MVLLAVAMVGLAGAGPVISEFLASNDIVLADEDGDYPDWVELYNPDAAAVDLTGWHLTDDATLLTKWTFPSTSIPAGGYLVVFASDKDRAAAGSELHTNFKLKAGGEYLALVPPEDTTPASEFFPSYPIQQTDVSYGLPQGTQITAAVVAPESGLRFLVPTGTVPGWNAAGIDDSPWALGTTGIGYERDRGYGPLISSDIESAAYDVNGTVYLRIPFTVDDASEVTALTFKAKYDDGFTAFLNGEPLTSANSPGSPIWSSLSTANREADPAVYDEWDVSAKIPHLLTGDNLLAIQMLNRSTTSSDFLMLPILETTVTASSEAGQHEYFTLPTPGSINNTPPGEPSGPVAISEPSGIKTTAVTVTMTAGDPTAEIRYTLDGSVPTETSTLYVAPVPLSDPARLRAKAYETGKVGGKLAVADYSFLDASVLAYLADVPVIVMDNFGAGAYPNKGRASPNDGGGLQNLPRQPNVMSFFDTVGDSLPFSHAPSLQTRAGCRVRGSSGSTFPRKSLSIEFWDGENEERSLSPYGLAPEADWALYAPYYTYDKSLLHNPVSFEIAKLLGALAPDSRVVVVFQNKEGGKVSLGDLAGVYVLMEKIERDRMGADFKKMDATGTSGGWMLGIGRMPAIPAGMPADTLQAQFHAAGPDRILTNPDDLAAGGSQTADDLPALWSSYLSFLSPDGFGILPAQRTTIQAQVRAMDAAMWSVTFDDPDIGYAAFIDVDSWARYYAVQNFTTNKDAITFSTYLFKESPAEKIRMGPVWDFDRAYRQSGSATSDPLWGADRDWFRALFRDIDFKQAHQDLWQDARHTVLTDSVLLDLVDQSAAGLRGDQIAASGVSHSAWRNELTLMKSWMVNRARFLDGQYEALPSVSPATGEFIGSILASMSVSAGGTVYYTTDGSDPRAPGGGIAVSATRYSSPLTLTQRTHLIARTKDGARWSGRTVRDYYQASELPMLVISEIAYHPMAPDGAELALGYEDSDDFEFLEIQNVGPAAASLATLTLDGGVVFGFAAGHVASLAPGARVLVVRNQAAFEARYGLGHSIAGVYQGALNNAGDRIILRDTVAEIAPFLDFTYDDASPWPIPADGDGYSLVLKQPETEPDHAMASNWRISSHLGGNPGSSDARPLFSGVTSADDDGDGISALLEHYFGTSDQLVGEGVGHYRMGNVTLAGGGTYPAFVVDYAIAADDLTGVVEWSVDLESWSDLPDQVHMHGDTPHDDGTATKTWRSTLPITVAPSQFFRLKVDSH